LIFGSLIHDADDLTDGGWCVEAAGLFGGG
jgi:hypothetical protein